MLLYSATILVLSLPFATANCHADNCYRAIKAYQTATVTGFCSQYLSHKTEAPTQFASCGPCRVSSACKCLGSSTSDVSSSISISTSTSSTAPPSATELVSNGGFESGVLNPWAIAAGSGYVKISDNSESSPNFPFQAHSGTKFVQIGNPGDENPGTLSQPVSLVSGRTYSFKAYYTVLDLPLSACHLKASVDGSVIAQADIYSGAGGGNPPGYYLLSGTYLSSSTGTSTLQLGLWCDYSSIGGVFGIDDISLV